MEKVATAWPLGRDLISGSLPTLPSRMTLLTLFAIEFSGGARISKAFLRRCAGQALRQRGNACGDEGSVRSRVLGALLRFEECSAIKIFECLPELGLGVHYDRTIPGNG